MPLETWIAYVATVLLLMSTPGPSHLLMLSNAMANGFPRAVATAAGDLTANTLQILAAGLGLAAIVVASETVFLAVKWAGVAYLVWMGVRQILRASGGRVGGRIGEGARRSLQSLWWQGFLTSAANPKAVVFFAALFPQFLDPNAPLWPQILILGASYLVIDGAFLAAYGASAAWMARRFVGAARQWLERVSGGLLIGAAILLGVRGVER